MRLSGFLLFGYIILALMTLGIYWASLPSRYTATRSFAANHRIVKGDFAPDPKFDDEPRYFRAAVKADEQSTKAALTTAPIAWPTKEHILVAFDSAMLPTGADTGDRVSLCNAKGGELTAVTIAAFDCGAAKGANCRVSVETSRDAAGALFSPDVAKGPITFAANGGCKASPAAMPPARPRSHRQPGARSPMTECKAHSRPAGFRNPNG